MDIMLSIKPVYAKAILEGRKLFEYRKRIPKSCHTNKIVIYATRPVMAVVGEARVVDLLIASVITLWERTKANAGISKEEYEEYFRGCEIAYAFKLGEVVEFDKYKLLADYGVAKAPQSFRYI